MNARTFTIFAGDASWRVSAADETHDVTVEPGAAPEASAAACAKKLAELGHRGEGVVLALPSTWCLSAPVATQGLPPRGGARRQAAVYRLEERLPVPAEEFTADFIEAGDEMLGVCVQNTRVAGLLQTLDSHGVPVEAVCPVSLLALETLRAQGKLSPDGVVVIAEGVSLDVLRLRRNQPVSWQLLREQSALASALAIEQLRSLPQLRVLVVGELDETTLLHDDSIIVERVGASPTGLAAASTASLLDGSAELAVNLRRDALAGSGVLRPIAKPLRFAAAAAAIALVLLAAAFAWRGHAFRSIERELLAEQGAVFHGALPGRPVPPSVKLALESEARRLRGVSGESAELPRQASALATFHETLRRLPTELRFRVFEVHVEEGRVFLDGEARSHGDAELVAAALRQHGALQVEPPRTEQLADRGVSFTLTGTATMEAKP